MRVLFISRSNDQGGGASKAAALLARELRAGGIELDYVMLEGQCREAWERPFAGRRMTRWIHRLHRRAHRVSGVPWLPVEGVGLATEGYDVVHLHDTFATISPWTVRRLARRSRLFVTMQDCSLFTGGCMYPRGCDHLETCGRCPQREYEHIKFDVTAANLRWKRRLLRRLRLNLIAPSAWITGAMQRSGVFSAPVNVIPNAYDPRIFDPVRRAAARAEFGLSDDAPAIIVSAASLADPRKNLGAAIAALRRLDLGRLQVLLMGRPAALDLDPRWPLRFLGYVDQPERMADALAAGDVFVFPSLQDNCPLAVIESLGVGTPVIAYRDSGGTPELIRDGEDGVLAAFDNVEALAAGLREFLANAPHWARSRAAIAARARDRFAIAPCAAAHVALYRTAMS
jgi:glycosyltransferase involved in cell wall biosynthesis